VRFFGRFFSTVIRIFLPSFYRNVFGDLKKDSGREVECCVPKYLLTLLVVLLLLPRGGLMLREVVVKDLSFIGKNSSG